MRAAVVRPYRALKQMTLCDARLLVLGAGVEGDFLHLASDNGFSSEELLHLTTEACSPLPVDGG